MDIQPTGYRFSGNGYVILNSKPYSFKHRSNVQFKFKASQENSDGLMFYAGQNEHFISVEMKSGDVYFQYKLGQHLVSLGSSIGSQERFNDDKWHRVEVERNGRAGILKIDGKTIRQEESPIGTEENLKISETMYFGGHPTFLNHSEIIHKNFDGCIDDVFISGTPVNLSHNLKAYGVRAGCATKFSSKVSFPPKQFGYLRQNISLSDPLRIILKFKTKQENGLIFAIANHQHEKPSTLTLQNGILVFQRQNSEISTHEYNKTFNDGEWHQVLLQRDENQLSLSVDTLETISMDIVKPEIVEDSDIYFGGVPKDFPLSLNTPYFVGCISDVYINGPVNLAEAIDRKFAILDSCTRDIIGKTHFLFFFQT